MNASQLWAELFTAAHPSTGDILLTRAELAARLGLEPRTISELMTELAGINAITRRKEGRRVIYAMNPNVATHIAGPEARKAARDAAGPLLTLMEGQNLTDIALPRRGKEGLQPPRRLSRLKGACRPFTRCSGQGKAQPCCGHEYAGELPTQTKFV